jgi:hypothetical protein
VEVFSVLATVVLAFVEILKKIIQDQHCGVRISQVFTILTSRVLGGGKTDTLNILQKKPNPLYLQDVVPVEVMKKYEQALVELQNGSKVVFFEYMLSRVTGDAWYESRLVPFTNNQNIMFVRNITQYRQSFNSELTQAYDKTNEGCTRALYLRDHET